MILMDTMKRGLSSFNLSIDIEMEEKFILFYELLIEWNEKMNLTSITEPKDVAILHFVDSLIPMTFMDFNHKKVIDVGTGAGFPGIPLAIVNPKMDIILLDAQKKRLVFLETLIKALGLRNTTLLHMRSEIAGKDKNHREKYDYAISRAVAPMPLLLEYMVPLIKEKGYFLGLKGKTVGEEIEAAGAGFTKLGLSAPTVHFIDMPETDRKHSFIKAMKIRQTPTKYPRNHGQIVKNPIN